MATYSFQNYIKKWLEALQKWKKKPSIDNLITQKLIQKWILPEKAAEIYPQWPGTRDNLITNRQIQLGKLSKEKAEVYPQWKETPLKRVVRKLKK
jgi:hypothetical protein